MTRRCIAFLLPAALLAVLPGVALADNNPAGPAPIPPLATMTSPVAGASVKGDVPILGAADWPNGQNPYNFASYTLSWGAGSNPASLTTFDFEQVPNAGGQLGVWRTAGLPDGEYVIQLAVANHTGNYALVVVPVIVDNSGGYSGPVFATSSPKPQPSGTGPSAVVLNSSSYTDPTLGQMHIVGEVQNNGNGNLQFVQITATFKDASGKALRSSSGFTALPILVPGQKAPFDVITQLPPGSSGAADLAVSYSAAPNPPAAGLAISGDQLQFDASGNLHLRGTVTDSSRSAGAPITLAYAVYDASGTTVRAGVYNVVSNASGSPLFLAAGTSGQFDYIVPNPPAFGSYTLSIQ